MPYAEEAAAIAKEKGFFNNVGLHLNLVEGCPLGKRMRASVLCDERGYLKRTLSQSTRYRLLLNSDLKAAVKEEIIAQIEKYNALGFTMKHLDSHQHVHNDLSIMKVLMPLLKSYKFKSIRLCRNIPSQEISGIKRIYKEYMNNRFVRFNEKNGNGIAANVERFGTQTDFQRDMKRTNGVYEIMAHPVLVDGIISDSVNRLCVEEFVKNTGLIFCNEYFEVPFNN